MERATFASVPGDLAPSSHPTGFARARHTSIVEFGTSLIWYKEFGKTRSEVNDSHPSPVPHALVRTHARDPFALSGSTWREKNGRFPYNNPLAPVGGLVRLVIVGSVRLFDIARR